jgi:hypothetical protein
MNGHRDSRPARGIPAVHCGEDVKSSEWIVHPNRFELGPDKPGRNGHVRSVSRPRPAASVSTCRARVTLPGKLSHLGDADGSVTFGGLDWWFVVGAARAFAREHIAGDILPPFGFQDSGRWWWWDDTTSEDSILDTPEAIGYVREYLNRLFPSLSVALSDTR